MIGCPRRSMRGGRLSLRGEATQTGAALCRLLFVRSCHCLRGAAGLCPAPPRPFPPSKSSTAVLRGKTEPLAQEEDERGKEDAQRHQKVGIEGIAFRPHAVPHPIAVDARFEQAGKHKIQLMIAPRRIVEEKIGQQQPRRSAPSSQPAAQHEELVPPVHAAQHDHIQNDNTHDAHPA